MQVEEKCDQNIHGDYYRCHMNKRDWIYRSDLLKVKRLP